MKKYKTHIVFTLIIILQIATVLYWARCKENYHVDELYSMRYAKGFADGMADDAYYITDSPYFKFNEWISNSTLKSYLIVSPGSRVFDMPFIIAFRRIFFGKSYWGLLNTFESVLGFQFTSVIPGILLNISFFVIFQISLLCLVKNLKMSLLSRGLCMSMLGFSCYVLSLVLYIRFYMLAMMLMIILMNCFYRLWDANNWKQVVLWEILMLITSYYSYKNCELFIPFIGAYMVSFVVALVVKKKWRQLAINAVLFVSVSLYVVFNTILIKVLIHPEEYLEYDQYVRKALNIRTISLARMYESVLWIYQLFRDMFFASSSVFWLALGAAMACLIVYMVLSEYGTIKSSPLLSDDLAFVLILVGATAIYTAFIILGEFTIWRYYCYGFMALSIVIWYIIDRLIRKINIDKLRKAFLIVLTIVVAINVITPFYSRNLQNVYENEREFIENVRNNRFLDVVLFVNTDNGRISKADTYDCINMISGEQKLYVVDYGKKPYDKVDYPDVFILWSHRDNDLSIVVDELHQKGYSVDEMGKDHYSQALFCKKQS